MVHKRTHHHGCIVLTMQWFQIVVFIIIIIIIYCYYYYYYRQNVRWFIRWSIYLLFQVLKILPGHQLLYSFGGTKLFLCWVGYFLGGNGKIPKFLCVCVGGDPTPNDTVNPYLSPCLPKSQTLIFSVFRRINHNVLKTYHTYFL